MNQKTSIIEDAVQDDQNMEELIMAYTLACVDQYDRHQGLWVRLMALGPSHTMGPKFLGPGPTSRDH